MTDEIMTPQVEVTQEPEVAGEKPQDPNVVGSVLPDEQARLVSFRQQMTQLQMEIGALEIRKARMLGAMSNMEEQAQVVLNGIGNRLNVPQGQHWQILPDSRVVLVNNPTEQPKAG